MGVVLTPESPHLLSEGKIIARLAEAVHESVSPVPWRWLADDYDRVRSLIERVVPGFDDFNMRVLEPGGIYLANPAKQRVWETPTRKATLGLAAMDVFEVSAGRLVLQDLRSHDQFNTAIPYEMPRGSAAAYFPEANILVPTTSTAEGSGTPTSKAVEIEIVISNDPRVVRGDDLIVVSSSSAMKKGH